MKLSDWLDSGDLQREPASREEIGRLLSIADRDLADAAAAGISLDRQFAIAYDAALMLSTAALRAAGYRVRGSSSAHHWLTFALLPEITGPEAEARSRYYQACRRRRHQAMYERVGAATETELRELVQEVKAFRKEVVGWLREHHVALAPRTQGESC